MRSLSKITVAAALGLLLLCGFAKGPQSNPAADRPQPQHDSLKALYLYTDAIKKALIDSSRTEAVALLRRAVAADSTYAPAWYELAGDELYKEPDRAVDYARRALAADSSDKWYMQRLGQALLVARRYNEAIPVYEKLLKADRNPDDYRILAILYEQNERPFSAIAILDSADGQFGRIPALSDIKRRLLLATRQYDKALDEASAAVAAIPYAPDNYIALGEVYERKGQDSLAHASFRKAVEVDSSSLYAWASLGDYYLRKQDHHANLEVSQQLFSFDHTPLEDKLDMFRRMTADRRFYSEYYPQINRLAATLYIKYPDEPRVVKLYAQHLIESGYIEQAADVYKRHLDDQPPQLEYYTMISAIESYLERPDSSDRYLTLALERFPLDAEVHILRGGRFHLEGRYKEALKCFRTALKYAGSDSLRSEIWGYTGDVYHARSAGRRADMKRCYAAYDKALKAYADNTSVLNNYAYFLAQEGRDLERALTMAERATTLSENNATYLDTRAWVLYRMSRYEEAKRIQRQALSLDRSESPELRLHYGDILAALGDTYMAEVYWRRALEAGYRDPEAVERRILKLKNRQQ
ncbi:MAG: tetratricopeptide repeat protein [Alistipes sp.]|nr:tetratricopeptide repeat protein [Alistipes sp.]